MSHVLSQPLMDILHKQERIIICLTVVQRCWDYSSCSATITYACHMETDWSGRLQLPGLELGWCQAATGYRICFSIKMNFFIKVLLWKQHPWREGVHHHWASSNSLQLSAGWRTEVGLDNRRVVPSNAREYHATVWNVLSKRSIIVLLPLAHWVGLELAHHNVSTGHMPRPLLLSLYHKVMNLCPALPEGISKGTQNVQQLRWQRGNASGKGFLDPP